jgi:uncharacterized protein (TIGR00251 family)
MAMVRVHVVPNAKQNKVAGEYGDAVRIKLRAPAIEGKANAALIRFLAELLGLPPHAIVLEQGHRSRHKLVRIDGLSAAEVLKHLSAQSDAI